MSQPPLSICMTPRWAEYKQAGKPDVLRVSKKRKVKASPKPVKCKVQKMKPLLSICMGPWWSQYKQGWRETIPPVIRLVDYQLMSDLAIWAQQVVADASTSLARNRFPALADSPTKAYLHVPRRQHDFAVLQFVRNIKRQFLPRSQQEFAVLEFVRQMKREYMPRSQQEFAVLEFVRQMKREYMPRSQQEFAVLEFVRQMKREYMPRSQQEFAVLEFVRQMKREYMPRIQDQFAVLEFKNNEERKTDNVRNKEDCKMDHLESMDDEWVQVEDDDDDWLQVDDLYNSSDLEDFCVVTANCATGCALTRDGRVIELDGGGPVTFPCEAEQSSGHVRKVAAISMAKASSGARLAKVASDVDTEVIASLDAAGRVRGDAALHVTAGQAKKARLKLFHRKQQGRSSSSRPARHSQEFSVDASGNVFLFSVKKPRRIVRVHVLKTSASVMTIDDIGVVRDMAEIWDVRRGLDVNPDVVLTIDANGVIRTHDDPFAGL